MTEHPEQDVCAVVVSYHPDPLAIQRMVEVVAGQVGAVRWVECMQAIKARGVSHIVECGPGKVLAGLVKRIDADLTGAPLFDPASTTHVKELLV